MPAHISRWQLGAWGEQKTKKELKPLKREGWTVRHDAAWGARANHDHVVAGPAVYVLNSKNVPDSRVEIEGEHLRVTHLDNPEDGYLADRWIPAVETEARAVERRFGRELGFPVTVYPVVVIWGAFAERQRYVGEVSVVDGLHFVEWLRSRPADLVTSEKRERVSAWVRTLPRA
jgi:hypothetical protein